MCMMSRISLSPSPAGDGSDNTPFEMVVNGGVLSLVLKADQAGVIDQDQDDPVGSYDLTISYNGSLTFSHSVDYTGE